MWCNNPEETVAFMEKVEKPWIAFKVMAAGAIPPRMAFPYAYRNGADFIIAGMFDFQVETDVKTGHREPCRRSAAANGRGGRKETRAAKRSGQGRNPALRSLAEHASCIALDSSRHAVNAPENIPPSQESVETQVLAKKFPRRIVIFL